MPLWERIYGDIKSTELKVNEAVQNLQNLIRNVGDDNAGQEQLNSIKQSQTIVDDLMKKYYTLLGEMDLFVLNGGSDSQKNILNRFKDVYKEISNSYRTAKVNAKRKSARIELFSDSYKSKNEDDSETQLLLKEMNATNNSLRMADSFLESAIESHESIRNQGSRLQNSRGIMAGIGSRFPVIQNLTNSIYYKKYRDNVIIAVFIAICFYFCLWYAFH